MNSPNNRVRAKFECKAGHLHDPLCVAISRGVPPELRCQPDQPTGVGGGGGGGCSLPNDWQERVERELWDNFQESKRRGFVLIVE